VEDVRSLVIRAQTGDLDAYGEVVRRFQDMAYGYAYAALHDSHLAEDAAQEAFVEAYRSFGQLREPAAFAGWLRRIVAKYCDRQTRRRKVPAVPLEGAQTVASGAPDPSEAVAASDLRERVLKAVAALPAPERTATTLFYINGYSEAEIADFLEVPVDTVKNRLRASRRRLKERMMSMVKDSLRENAPDERFSRKVIDELLSRPRPLEIEGHPVRRVWEEIRAALPEYEVIAGDEVEDADALAALQEDMDKVYHVGAGKVLRTQTTVTTFKAIRGRRPPVRLLTAGRVFRTDAEDSRHLKVFHQLDGICVEAGADLDALKSTCLRVLTAVVGDVDVRWHEASFRIVEQELEAQILIAGRWQDILGCGVLKRETLRETGYDPGKVGGFSFGFGLERLAQVKFGIDDIRKLWQPPYV
jgi:RNA polymerase sigma factor (sigma-70 family)